MGQEKRALMDNILLPVKKHQKQLDDSVPRFNKEVKHTNEKPLMELCN